MDLQTPIRDAGRWYQRNARGLEKLGIYRLSDLLFHVPFRYEDYSLISNIANVQEGEIVTIQGNILTIDNAYTRGGMKLQKALVSDDTGTIQVTWFNQPYLSKILKKGDAVSLSGKIEIFNNTLLLQSPEYEVLAQNNTKPRTIHTGRLVPVYPETRGVTSKWLRRQVFTLLSDKASILSLDTLPQQIKETHSLLDIHDAFCRIHFPNNVGETQKAKERLAFDELFYIQLRSLKKRQDWEKLLLGTALPFEKHQDKIDIFIASLPFVLTGAQQKALRDILNDVSKDKPMNRLLEGDVGSGKTIVATIAMYVAYLNGHQSALMAPTEILAQQHYATISRLLEPLGVNVGLHTGSHKGKAKSADILIGTHAVLSEKINFDKLGLVVIDEQQRFGVSQRATLRKKGRNPHVLTMTATPIPRTVALTLYGDLDLSVLDEMPKGRKIVKTWVVPTEKRDAAYAWIEKQIRQTQSQAFIVCPFIEQSESMQTVKAATKEFERLKKAVFPNIKLGLLHGKLKAKQKNEVLDAFRNGKFDILVCTPVVEVGIDIPNASIMLTEAAERFGLAQLHQLRGRVGRGDKQSYCLLFTDSKNEQTVKRLKAMEIHNIGSKLAEIDLQLRGPGDIYGISQHGMRKLKVAHFSDVVLIEKTRKEALHVVKNPNDYPSVFENIDKEASDVTPD